MPVRNQTDIELEVFREFAAVVEMPIILSTISRRNPPEPDLVCEVRGQGLLGFELTELIDAQFMSRLDLMAKTRKALTQHWQKLPQADSAKFKTKYDNALLHFRFGSDVGYLKRSATFAALFSELLALPDGFVGEALRLDNRFLPTLEAIVVRRGEFVGPIVDVDSFGWLGDPTKDTVSSKLAKTYECSYPVELLAYVDWDLLPPEGAWKAAADEATIDLEDLQIRRVWVFDRGKKQVVYVQPPR